MMREKREGEMYAEFVSEKYMGNIIMYEEMLEYVIYCDIFILHIIVSTKKYTNPSLFMTLQSSQKIF